MFPNFSKMTVSALALIALSGISAEARPTRAPILTADLKIVSLDSKLGYDADRANVELDQGKQQITLTLSQDWSCPPGMFCATVMPPVRVFTAPVTQTLNDCGSTVYVAEVDQRPVDGALTRITLQDNRSRMCRDLREPTEVSLETAIWDRRLGREVKTFYEFTGKDLISKSPVNPPSHGGTYEAVLDTFKVDKKLLRGAPIHNARVEVSHASNTATLVINYNPCAAPGSLCMAISAEFRAELPIVSRKTIGCGTTEIVASEDLRPADGNFEELRILDHRTRICEDMPLNMTEVRFTTETAGMSGAVVKTRSTLAGSVFVRK